MINKLIEKFGIEAIDDGHCAIHFDKEFKDFKQLVSMFGPFDTIIEIGTNRGITAAILSQFARRVITIDIKYQNWCFEFWHHLGIHNISYFVYKPEWIHEYLNNEKFGFAFIDGDHTRQAPMKDFEAVKKCGTVLFHDWFVDKRFPAVNQTIETLEGYLWFKEPYVLWRAK